MITDPIADYLTRIRNASRIRKDTTLIPYSKIKEEISKVLMHNKFIEKYEVKQNGTFQEIIITLKSWVKEPISLKRVSKPGQRIYLHSKDLKPVKHGLGMYILSTSKGIKSSKDAKKENLGGEVICEVY